MRKNEREKESRKDETEDDEERENEFLEQSGNISPERFSTR